MLLLLIFCKPLLSVQSFQSLHDLLTIVFYNFKQLPIIWRYFEAGGSKLWENIGKWMAAAAVIKVKNRKGLGMWHEIRWNRAPRWYLRTCYSVVANRVVGVIVRAWVQTLIHANFYPQWALASAKPFSFHPRIPRRHFTKLSKFSSA